MRIKRALALGAVVVLPACSSQVPAPKSAPPVQSAAPAVQPGAVDAPRGECDPTRVQCPLRKCAPGEEPVQLPNPLEVNSALGANVSPRLSCIKPPA